MEISLNHPGRSSQIVDAATKLFAGQGYHATTTRQIAKLASVSENTIFRHFEHKEDIFWASLRAQLGQVRLRQSLATAIAERRAPEAVIQALLDMVIQTIIVRPHLIRLVATAFLELGPKASGICDEYFYPVFAEIAGYIEECVKSGKMRDFNPGIVMAAISGTVIVQPLFSRFTSIQISSRSDRRSAVAAYKKFWIDVLCPPAFVTERPGDPVE